MKKILKQSGKKNPNGREDFLMLFSPRMKAGTGSDKDLFECGLFLVAYPRESQTTYHSALAVLQH
jgi:hypothetical protein